MIKRICYDSILGILTDCCVADSKSWTDSNVVMVLQTVTCGGAECWETVTGLNWLQCGGKGVFGVLCEVGKCVLIQLTVMMHIAILQTVQFVGAEC